MLRNSLVRQVTAVVAVISLVAVVNIMVSLAVSGSIQGSGAAINVAGSLRMQSYQLLAQWPELETTASADWQRSLARFTARLQEPVLLDELPPADDAPLRQQYQQVTNLWQDQLRPLLIQQPETVDTTRLHQLVSSLVAETETLVTLLERQTESRIQIMNLVQVVSLVFTLVGIVALVLATRNRVVRPLYRLLQIARSVGRKDFSQRSGFTGQDELSRLGQAFDQMAGQLAVSYQTLESEASNKARELERSHAALQLIHSASGALFASGDICRGAIPLLQDLEKLLGIGPIRLFLHDRHAAEPVEALTTATVERPYYCRDHECDACLVSPQALDQLPAKAGGGRRLLLPIKTGDLLLGTLEVWYPGDGPLEATARRLLETLSDQLATAIFLQRQMTEQQHLTLAEERAVIARELHDSLAQSLSYLKMQVARLRRLDISTDNAARHSDILDELSTGLNSAYRQLRELLTTFRLKLDTPDLGTALRHTTEEFSERLPNPVRLTYELPPQTLSANEEIHVLQIIREALANTVKHAEASEVDVRVTFESPRVRVQVMDNGRGLPQSGQPPQHYGLIIMHDRARTLGGALAVTGGESGGVVVELSFVPKSRHLINQKPQATTSTR